MKHYNVVAAIIMHNNKILCMQRGPSKYNYISNKYEFPGGKIEENETEINALIREIKEELIIDISVEKKFIIVDHTYPDFKITMHCYICTSESKAFTLTEHIDYKWLEKLELEKLDWAAADIPIIKKLINE
ncbi:MAG: (deoxy)nucleoside triphosphate pyrophosphohydrolase [Campylobacteraceae bacterium]|jgi:8-oxo-dGTP diphosphatase|nr:(deoxy)nucleoside triphosphate pyrophosphohydrolase [Campylobacteraceae bacterium]MBT3881758.1 (deoxy)nucleoside triphosphate pyrophosphohydrolase [Campylobacteraceae bacterium]MBT4178696.1 (deoxy)nucleoside triphosphate pyrophosphohydrolase [Campylobacteraceae bacterium]MBT4571954.1 (deoxy)nucleoside triphosphate pyrophosphohydrolase [Campylobacteraceae bacterium]MBT4708267.1 (deoxy)nucleoside triphosphate pyrophosphohydrolase [Campylobacteraceae bacterium]